MTTYLEGFEQLAPGFASEDSYINAVKSAPSSGLVVDFALMKGRSRLAEESPYRLTFSNDPWGSFMMSEANGIWIGGGLGSPVLEEDAQLRGTASEALPL